MVLKIHLAIEFFKENVTQLASWCKFLGLKVFCGLFVFFFNFLRGFFVTGEFIVNVVLDWSQ